MITLLGAGGVIGNELAKLLAAQQRPFRLVSRTPHPTSGATETATADLTDLNATIKAVQGSTVVHLVAGLKYDRQVWAEQWPRIMGNAIEACKRAGARLIFFDNVYMYGRVSGPMTEGTPFNPCSKKGEIRARIADVLIEEWTKGDLTALIARAADFHGPNARTAVPNSLVIEPLSKKGKASCLVSDSLPHSYTYTPDAAHALLALSMADSVWNQTWHLPTAPDPPTAKEFIGMAANELQVAPKYRTLSRGNLRIAGWFRPDIAELHEMLYQYDSPYLFDSSKYAKAFGFEGTPYVEGIRATVALLRDNSKGSTTA